LKDFDELVSFMPGHSMVLTGIPKSRQIALCIADNGAHYRLITGINGQFLRLNINHWQYF